MFSVHCRIGSLEMFRLPLAQHNAVHCRIGSLENHLAAEGTLDTRSLPHRQFRKLLETSDPDPIRSLPHRQFRKA